jgi:drug/metabolite transporter (DMT)-like permease
MTALILILVLASATMHPLREFLVKGDQTPSGVALAVIIQFCLLSGILTWYKGIDPWVAFDVWPTMLASGLGTLFYYWCVLIILKTGDLSIYYPIARSSPLFVVIIGFLFFGHTFSPLMLSGIALILVGAFLLQYQPGGNTFSQPRIFLMAILALCSHGVVTLADAESMKVVEPSSYLFVQYIFMIPGMILVSMTTKMREQSLYQHLLSGWIRTPCRYISAGVMSYASYYLILWAFHLGGSAAAVSSVRLTSIPLSVILGCWVFKEARLSARLGWSLLITIGIVVIIYSK